MLKNDSEEISGITEHLTSKHFPNININIHISIHYMYEKMTDRFDEIKEILLMYKNKKKGKKKKRIRNI